MRNLLVFIFLVASILTTAQNSIVITGKTFTNSDQVWNGVEIERSQPVKLEFKNNSITSRNDVGYMLQAGDEAPSSNDNNLRGAVITGNKLTWNGFDVESITHGIFTGHNNDVLIKYNNLLHVPMGIIRKSGNNLSETGGGIAYNIVRNGAVAVVIKGMSNVRIFNNTFYTERTAEQTWRPLIQIYTNTDNNRNSVAHGTKIYNNIFYTKYETPSITVEDQESLKGMECDFNIYWCETGSPRFLVNGDNLSFNEWQKLGFDAHSSVMNPRFRNLTDFVPESRLDYGTDLGAEWDKGLAVNAVWGTVDPATAIQNGHWQVGAIIYGGGAAPASKLEIYPNPVRTYFTISNTGTDNLPEIIKIYDLAGKLRFEKTIVNTFQDKINIKLSPGVYVLHIVLGGSETEHIQKIVVIR